MSEFEQFRDRYNLVKTPLTSLSAELDKIYDFAESHRADLSIRFRRFMINFGNTKEFKKDTPLLEYIKGMKTQIDTHLRLSLVNAKAEEIHKIQFENGEFTCVTYKTHIVDPDIYINLYRLLTETNQEDKLKVFVCAMIQFSLLVALDLTVFIDLGEIMHIAEQILLPNKQ